MGDFEGAGPRARRLRRRVPELRGRADLPAISLSDLFTEPPGALDQERIETVLDARPALLLPGGDHPRPRDGRARRHRQHRLRDPGRAARRAAGADRRDPRRDRPAGTGRPPEGVEVERRRPAGARGRRQRRRSSAAATGSPLAGLLAVALALLAVYRSLRAGAGAADPDRARDRLVGAGRLRRCDIAAQPDVGDAGRAGDRDRDRVQRHPLGALPRGARRRASRSARRCAAPTRAPAPRCSPRASTAIAGFAVLDRVAASGCCATSAWSRSSTSRSPCSA